MAVLVALIRGFARRRRGRHRQLLGRPDPQHALHPAAAVARAGAGARLAGRGADLRGPRDGAAARPARRRRRAAVTEQTHRARAGRVAGRDQAARHERRRLLQRQLRAPVREPDAALQLPRDARDPADPGRALLHLRRAWSKDRRQGWALLARDAGDLRPAAAGVRSRPSRRGNPLLAALGVDQAPAPLQAGGNMEGKEVRFGIANTALWADRDDRRVERLGQRDARQLHAARRPGADVADAARRGRLRRRRLRALRHAHLRDHRRVHRRADGRAHAGVPRQEDRGLRDEDGVAGRSCCRRRAVLVGTAHRVLVPAGTARARQPRPARLQRDPLRLLLAARTTTAPPSPGSPRTAPFYTTALGVVHAGRPLLGDRPGARRSPARWRARSTCRRAPARCPRTRRCSSACWSAPSCSSARSPSSRRSRSARSSSTCTLSGALSEIAP